MRVTTPVNLLQADLKVKLTPENRAAVKALNVLLKEERNRITFTNNSKRLNKLSPGAKKSLRRFHKIQLAKFGFVLWLVGDLALLGRTKEACTILDKGTNKILEDLLIMANQELAKEAIEPEPIPSPSFFELIQKLLARINFEEILAGGLEKGVVDN